MKDTIEKTMLRTRQYWFIDGLAELGLGGLCFLLGVYFALQATLPPNSTIVNLLEASLVLVLVGGYLLANRAIKIAKSRLTYPRTGFVSYRKSGQGKRWFGAVIAMLIAGLVAALMASAPASLAWMPAITGFVLGAVLLYLGMRVDLLRFYFLALFAVILGFLLSFFGIGDILGLGIFYTLISVALFLSGGVTLRSYLRENQVAQNH